MKKMISNIFNFSRNIDIDQAKLAKPKYIMVANSTSDPRDIDYSLYPTDPFRSICAYHELMYHNSNWARLAIEIIANACLNTIPYIDMKINKQKLYIPTFKDTVKTLHRITKFPNKEMSFRELLFLALVDLQVYGNAFWQIIKERGTKKLSQLVRIDPRTLEFLPYIDKKTGIKYMVYYQEINGHINIFTEDEIIHFRRPNISSDFQGLSSLSCLYYLVNMDLRTQKFQNNFFQNGMGLGVIFSIKDVSSEKIKELNQKLNAKYNINKNPYSPLIIENGDVEIVSDGTKNLRDLDLRELKKANREEILASLGVSEYIANMKMIDKQDHAIRLFYEHHVEPLRSIILDTLNLKLINLLYGIENNDIEFVKGKSMITGTKDTAEMLKILMQLTPMQINEVRELSGLRPLVEGGNIFTQYTPNGVAYPDFTLNTTDSKRNTEEYLDPENPNPSLIESDLNFRLEDDNIYKSFGND